MSATPPQDKGGTCEQKRRTSPELAAEARTGGNETFGDTHMPVA